MNISIVVCTRNRGDKLKKCLDYFRLLRANFKFELIVVDNGSSDNTAEVLNDFRMHVAFPVFVVNEPSPGLGRARNAGWPNARGDIIAFTDDDCYPASDWLDSICNCFKNSDIGFLGGRVELYDHSDLPTTIQLQDHREVIPPYSYVRPGFIQGANFSFKKEALVSVGGFDSELGAGTPFPCEDVEVLARLSAKGWAGAYDPRPLIYHHHGRKTDDEMRKLKVSYDYGRGAYYAKSILRLPARLLFLKYWYWSINKTSLCSGQFFREFSSAIRYLLRRIL